MEQVYIVWWNRLDNSGMDFVCAFGVEEDAIHCKAMLEKHGDPGRQYSVTPVECASEF
jgi:hypothetical protein